MDLLDRPLYTMSGPDLDELLQLIEVLVAPLANLKEVRRLVSPVWMLSLQSHAARGGVRVVCLPGTGGAFVVEIDFHVALVLALCVMGV